MCVRINLPPVGFESKRGNNLEALVVLDEEGNKLLKLKSQYSYNLFVRRCEVYLHFEQIIENGEIPICECCGKPLTRDNISLDHVIPKDFGGPTFQQNLRIICKKCNSRKGNLLKKDSDKLLKMLKKREGRDKIKKFCHNKVEKTTKKFLKKKSFLPKSWITKIERDKIICAGEETISCDKETDFFKEHGFLKNIVIVDKNNKLLDQKSVYKILKQTCSKKEKVNVIKISNIEIDPLFFVSLDSESIKSPFD